MADKFYELSSSGLQDIGVYNNLGRRSSFAGIGVQTDKMRALKYIVENQNTIEAISEVPKKSLLSNINKDDMFMKECVNKLTKQTKLLNEIVWQQSHLVRAPLARLMGIVSILQDNSLSDSEKESFFQDIQSTAKELDNIIQDITSKIQGRIERTSYGN
ncbi:MULTISPECIES: histidine kinase dimerization/phospho-acceptor domain-containing protein [Emticicia]|uniref:histidine kinase dimerization/phospho-acceptor domain-containing protein n=1 Tax=Emticicia TaxID=312278 RepID=UPI0007D8A7C1|nr:MULTISPECIES: histidine kinase dimerization/phospho-acceptor domain-containing protein [Emticicia]